jgi:hypothetical protein
MLVPFTEIQSNCIYDKQKGFTFTQFRKRLGNIAGLMLRRITWMTKTYKPHHKALKRVSCSMLNLDLSRLRKSSTSPDVLPLIVEATNVVLLSNSACLQWCLPYSRGYQYGGTVSTAPEVGMCHQLSCGRQD